MGFAHKPHSVMRICSLVVVFMMMTGFCMRMYCAADKQQVDILLSWEANGTHVPFYIAELKGFF